MLAGPIGGWPIQTGMFEVDGQRLAQEQGKKPLTDNITKGGQILGTREPVVLRQDPTGGDSCSPFVLDKNSLGILEGTPLVKVFLD